MRVIFTHDVSDDTGTLLCRLVAAYAQLVHSEQHAALNRLKTVSYVWKRTAHNNAHRIVDIRLPHLLVNLDGNNLVMLSHRVQLALQFLIQFFVFVVHNIIFTFVSKPAAKVQLIFDLCKYFRLFFRFSCIFLYFSINTDRFCYHVLNRKYYPFSPPNDSFYTLPRA